MNKPTQKLQNEDKELTSSNEPATLKVETKTTASPEAPSEKKKTSYKFKRKRDGRIPLQKRRKLSFNGTKEGLHYHWLNDNDNDFTQLQEDGYAFINKKDNEPRDSGVPSQDGNIVRRSVGDGKYAYLMCTPQEWYEETQREKQKENDRIMADIGKVGIDIVPSSQQFGGVKITNTSKVDD